MGMIGVNEEIKEKSLKNIFYSDLFIELFRDSKVGGKKKVARLNVNLFLLNK